MVKLLLKYDSLLPILGTLVILAGMILNSMVGSEVSLGFFSNSSLFRWMNLGPFWVVQILAALSALGVAIFLNRLVQSESLLGGISNMPFFVISLLFFILPLEYNHPIFWIGCMFQILLIRQTLNIFSGEKISYEIFNQGLTIGGLGIFNPSFLAYYLISVRAMVLSARFDLKKALVVLVAMMIPLYFLNGFLYIIEEDLLFFSFSAIADWGFDDTFEFTKAVLLLIVMGIAFFQSRAQLSKATMREKRRWSLISLSILIGAFSILSFNYGYWLFTICVPVSIALARAILFIKNKWLAELYFILILGLIYLFKIDQ